MAEEIITGLDIGTAYTRAAIGLLSQNGSIEIVGVGEAPSQGLRRGVVVNIDSVLPSISSAIEDAERMAGYEVEEVVIGVSGEQIQGINSKGVVAISGKGKHIGKEISQSDIHRVTEAAQAVAIPMDRETLHVIPQQYVVDGQEGIRNPLGMIGVRLEAEVHIITGSISSARNLIKAINRAGFRVSGVALKSISAAETVLTTDEQELGVLLIDIGAGTTDVLVCVNGAPYYSSVLNIGGADITSDLSIVLKAPLHSAEELKTRMGTCVFHHGMNTEPILIPGVGGRPPLSVERLELVKIIEPRVTEILQLVRKRITAHNLMPKLGGGIVLTGGGSLLNGMIEVAQRTFDIVTRMGQPANYGGVINQYRTPLFSTATGLIKHFVGLHRNEEKKVMKENSGKLFINAKKWLKNFFE